MKYKMPRVREGRAYTARVGDCDIQFRVGMYPDTEIPGEVFITAAKQGSTIRGLLDTIAICISMGLQYGVPLEEYVSKLSEMKFEPLGHTDDPDIPEALSICDYIANRLKLDYLWTSDELDQDAL